MERNLTTIRRFLVGASLVVSLMTPALGGPVALAEESAQTVTLAPHGTAMMLTDGQGWTVYRWQGDERDVSNCVGECTAFWPPVTTDGPLVANRDVLPHLGTIERADGTWQVTFDGAPLYYNFYDVSGISPTTGYYTPENVHPGLTLGDGSQSYGYRWSIVALDSRTLLGDAAP